MFQLLLGKKIFLRKHILHNLVLLKLFISGNDVFAYERNSIYKYVHNTMNDPRWSEQYNYKML